MSKSFASDFSDGALSDISENSIQEFAKEGCTNSSSAIYRVSIMGEADSEAVRGHSHPKIKEPATTNTVDPDVISMFKLSMTFLNISGTCTFRTLKKVRRQKGRI